MSGEVPAFTPPHAHLTTSPVLPSVCILKVARMGPVRTSPAIPYGISGPEYGDEAAGPTDKPPLNRSAIPRSHHPTSRATIPIPSEPNTTPLHR